jgi:hypothetical protein
MQAVAVIVSFTLSPAVYHRGAASLLSRPALPALIDRAANGVEGIALHDDDWSAIARLGADGITEIRPPDLALPQHIVRYHSMALAALPAARRRNLFSSSEWSASPQTASSPAGIDSSSGAKKCSANTWTKSSSVGKPCR